MAKKSVYIGRKDHDRFAKEVRMKRFSVILLALVLLVQLTACVTPADTTGEPVLTTDTPTSTTDKPADTTGTPYVTTAPPVTDTKPADQPLAFPSQIEGLKDHY